MADQRRLERRHLFLFLRVYEADGGDLLGHMIDLTKEGFMIVSDQPIEVDREFHLVIRIPGSVPGEGFLEFSGKSLWSKNDVNPVFYDTGFQFTSTAPDELGKIGDIIRSFGFRD